MTSQEWAAYLARERAALLARETERRARLDEARQAHAAAVRYYAASGSPRYWDAVEWPDETTIQQRAAPEPTLRDPHTPPSAGRTANTPRR